MAGPLRDPGPATEARLRSMTTADPSAGGSAKPEEDDAAATGLPTSPDVEPLPDAPVDAIEDWSLDQLHRRASEIDLEGRWEMTREQLIEALRETP